ncbi:TIGR02186 family protein [Amaricoccus sp.]|uniref:TIGR02186 family protein n=1 Tax=Amaricoccus sp. TaxID=1872485 RepID=UPI001B4FE36C|nr:TIGR02186 family protein [Amaricoccus sp.]MBP7240535.1 TIGR02186 family protein [Amaricoccus sp.]
MIRAAALAIACALAAPVAAQTVVTGISTENIALTADFTGSDVLVFGAIRRDAPIPVGEDPIDIVITLQGPPLSIVVRRKERRFGIWLNAEEVRVRRVPSYYAVATTRPIDEILTETERLRWQIGLDQATRRVAAHPTLADTTEFTEAAVRLRLADGLFVDAEGGVKLAEETLFQARFHLPTNLVEGEYATEYFLVRDREIISNGATAITVEKAGVERWLYNLAQNRPLAYGLLSVAVALAAGWLAAAAFRLARR